jgi:PKD repeat protein
MLGLGCLSAPAAFAAPDFTWTPDPANACELVTFMPTDLGDETASWEYDGVPGSDNTHTFTTEATHSVTMNVTKGPPVTHDVAIGNAAPVASFDYTPALPDPGEWIVFESTSTDCEDVLTFAWDFHDGTSSTAAEPVHKFDTAGPHDVTLIVDDGTVTDTITQTVYVGAVPTAAFHRDPLESVLLETGQQATFTSDSTASANNSITSSNWDVDGDGFDDGTGTVLTHTFTTPGTKVVRLQVEQTNGERDIAVLIFEVNAPPVAAAAPVQPTPPATPTPPAIPRLMTPFPTVRLVGVVLPTGARITLVEVRGGPRGARVTVRCTGKGCPFRSRRRVAETGRVRLSDFTRVLAAGARIQVFVRAPGVIGKYVGFRIRAGKRPLRTDRCLMPGASEPTRCT